MIKHLEENNISYWKHWWRAMKISGALFIHAFLPVGKSWAINKPMSNKHTKTLIKLLLLKSG